MELVRYIHLNRLRASVVRSLGELDLYTWSGHGALIGKEKNDWQERDYVLQQFHRNEKEADQKVTRYLPKERREGLIRDVIQKICQEEGVGEKELSLGGQARRVSSVRAKVAWELSREYGIAMAEIARHVGVCTSAIANALRKIEVEKKN